MQIEPGKVYQINALRIPGNFCYLTSFILSNSPFFDKDAKNILAKISNKGIISANFIGTFSSKESERAVFLHRETGTFIVLTTNYSEYINSPTIEKEVKEFKEDLEHFIQELENFIKKHI